MRIGQCFGCKCQKSTQRSTRFNKILSFPGAVLQPEPSQTQIPRRTNRRSAPSTCPPSCSFARNKTWASTAGYRLQPSRLPPAARRNQTSEMCDCVAGLCDSNICSAADTPLRRPALFRRGARPSSDGTLRCYLLLSLPAHPRSSVSSTGVNARAAPGAITDMLRPSVKPLSATYQTFFLYRKKEKKRTSHQATHAPPVPATRDFAILVVWGENFHHLSK